MLSAWISCLVPGRLSLKCYLQPLPKILERSHNACLVYESIRSRGCQVAITRYGASDFSAVFLFPTGPWPAVLCGVWASASFH